MNNTMTFSKHGNTVSIITTRGASTARLINSAGDYGEISCVEAQLRIAMLIRQGWQVA